MAYNKINWENGSVRREGYVLIDGQQYQTVQPEYEGDTPINADNLNHMDEGIKSAHDLIEDSGWIDLVPTASIGTWVALKYRKIGKIVNIIGNAYNVRVVSGSINNGNAFAMLPEEIRPMVDLGAHVDGTAGAQGRIKIRANGELLIDTMITQNGALSSDSAYIEFFATYFVD